MADPKNHTYKLYIYDLKTKSTSTDEFIVIANSGLTTVEYKKKSMNIGLWALKFTRKVYQPGLIEAEIQIQQKSGGLPTISELQEMLLKRKVLLKLGVAGVKNSFTLAENYYIHEIVPLYKKTSEKTSVYVKLSIYSMDKLMTLNKFSQAFLGRKLGTDILMTLAAQFPLKTKSYSGADKQYKMIANIDTLQHLSYVPTGKVSAVEFIQPYLVQYNENFYDFLKRTANRCGEFLFFENGMLNMGTGKKDTVAVTDYSQLVFQQISEAPFTVDDYTRDSANEAVEAPEEGSKGKLNVKEIEKTEGFPTDAFPASTNFVNTYNAEVVDDEYYMLLFKDQFADDNWYDSFGSADTNVVSVVNTVLNSTTLFDALKTLGISYAEVLVKGLLTANETNAKMNATVTDFAGADAKSAVPYNTTDTNTWMKVGYYSKIKKNEEAQQRKMICVDLGSEYQDIKLGTKITVNEDTKKYMVVQVDMHSDGTWQCSYDEYNGEGPQEGDGGRVMKVYAIPVADDEKYYPPVISAPSYRSSEAQTAFVISSDDPKGQGRVRIRYPWQANVSAQKSALEQQKKDATDALEKAEKALEDDKDNKEKIAAVAKAKKTLAEISYQYETVEATTPWIRMATPMATTGGGMYFKPEAGDEVIVNYETGNIERPYVVGTLYSKNVVSPTDKRVIKSPNGHIIKMDDPDDGTKFLAGMYPGLKWLQSFNLWPSDAKIEGMNALLGGITMTDTYGFYKLSMSSHDRKVQISSPFGDVKIDAFTGITISAPNGNIKIKGKNVDISAANNLTITSGTNVKPINGAGNWFAGGFVARNVAKGIASGLLDATVGKFLDFSLLRTLLEVFLRPIDGTLEIRSFRYLRLEAGGGCAETDSGKYNTTGTNLRAKDGTDNLALFGNFVGLIDARVNEYVDKLKSLMDSAITAWAGVGFADLYPEGNARVTAPANKTDLLAAIFNLQDATKTVELTFSDAMQGDEHQADRELIINFVNDACKKIQTLKAYANQPLFAHKTRTKSFFKFFDQWETKFEPLGKKVFDNIPNDDNNPASKFKKLILLSRSKVDGAAVGVGTEASLGAADFDTLLPEAQQTQAKNYMKRMAVCYLIKENKERFFLSRRFDVEVTDGGPSAADAIANAQVQEGDPTPWTQYVEHLNIKAPTTVGENIAAGILDSLNATFKDGFSFEHDVWRPEAKGEILFANGSDATTSFNAAGTGLVSNDNMYTTQANKAAVVKRIVRLLKKFG